MHAAAPSEAMVSEPISAPVALEPPNGALAPPPPAPISSGPVPMDTAEPGANAVSNPPKELPPLKVTFYQLLIRQLMDDGFLTEAQSLSQSLSIRPDHRVEKDALLEAYGKSLKWAFGEEPQSEWSSVNLTPVPPVAPEEKVLDFSHLSPGAAAARAAEADGLPPGVLPPEIQGGPLRRAPEVKQLFASQHKKSVRSVAFSADGRFVATGCLDGGITILDSARMRACSASTEGTLGRMRVTEEELQKPIVRTLQDHVLGITCLAFHPRNPTLFSGSLDKAVKIFDLTRPPGHKKAFSVLQDVHPVRSLCIHPCGDFLFVGTAHHALRLYDLQTLNCFTAFHQDHHHGDGINDVRCSSDGRMIATASSDGNIQLWDAVSHRVVNRLPRAHSGAAVSSLRWSRNLRYLLSSGLDGRHRVWDVREGKEIFTLGFGPRAVEWSTAVFAASERYIATINSNWRVSDASLFDASTGCPVFMKLGHHQMGVHALDSSPVDRTMMTGCDDEKARYLSIDDRGPVS